MLVLNSKLGFCGVSRCCQFEKSKTKKITRTEILVISTLLVFENTKTD